MPETDHTTDTNPSADSQRQPGLIDALDYFLHAPEAEFDRASKIVSVIRVYRETTKPATPPAAPTDKGRTVKASPHHARRPGLGLREAVTRPDSVTDDG